MGAKGAAYAALISWGLSAILFPLFWRRTRHYPILFIKSFIMNFKNTTGVLAAQITIDFYFLTKSL
jgi:Na+-driven multidrug efflux pump